MACQYGSERSTTTARDCAAEHVRGGVRGGCGGFRLGGCALLLAESAVHLQAALDQRFSRRTQGCSGVPAVRMVASLPREGGTGRLYYTTVSGLPHR